MALLATLVPEDSVDAIVDCDGERVTAYAAPHPFAYSDLFNGTLIPREDLRPIETFADCGEVLTESELRSRLAARGIMAKAGDAGSTQAGANSAEGEGEW